MAPPVGPVILLGAGAYLAWFGVHYWGTSTKWPSDPVKAVLTGKGLPAATGQTSAASTAAGIEAASPGAPTAAGTAAGQGITNSHTGSAIADDALKYVGEGYIYGGPSQPGKWDCSSFANYVIGHDLGQPIPGGSWAVVCDNGNSHGPATPSWMLFGTPINYGSEQPGDLLVTTEHMGIVIGGGGMVSAQDPELGTGIGNYTSGFPGGQPVVRRVSSG
jgi:cell wall-associated NlpC family hydrolase